MTRDEYPTDEPAVVTCGLPYAHGNRRVGHLGAFVAGVLAGTEGRLHGERSWWKGAPFTFTDTAGESTTYARPFEGNGYQFEAAHVMRCLREDRRESPVMPLDESRALLDTADALRAEWGVQYPGEE